MSAKYINVIITGKYTDDNEENYKCGVQVFSLKRYG